VSPAYIWCWWEGKEGEYKTEEMSTGMIDVCIGFQSASYKTDIYSSAGGQTDGRTDALFWWISKNMQVPMERETVASDYGNIEINSGNEFNASHSWKQR